ncbi:BTB/POZ domain-containing protein At3g49900-like [Abrus precatorius]|uniref:BTB/POZ domain-containing protein At3g49900-like n=1 Tax=Abrus precatorius TaxID=3816 RepID=A0A8B8M349_ABRPR|nr:BTB/POZ domain-containing protein At3g49900-like [Abrus precatorius]
MISQSSYLKRHLTGVSNFTLSPPLNITPEMFAAVAEFCYSRKVQLTPSNVAAIRTAAELLGMTEGESLCDVTEAYFESVVGVDASIVLRSCLPLLPDAETTASLASRCIEAMVWDDDVGCLNDVVVGMEPQDFQTVAYSLNKRLPNHDVLYKMVDLYLKENKHGKLTEEQKMEICNSLDCTKLSSETIVNCVQNPVMPLRFIVRAILVEHLNTRRSVAAATIIDAQQMERSSLRDFLQRDTARRETAQLKEAMDSTCSRIKSLEKELRGMRKILLEHEAEEEEKGNVLNSARSASFHFVAGEGESSKIERGGRGSVSSSGFLLDRIITSRNDEEESTHDGSGTPKTTRTFRHRFVSGLKNAFRISNSASN